MAMNVNDFTNQITLKGVVSGYKITKQEAKMMWNDERNGLKIGDPITQYQGYVTVKTGDNQFATVNVRKNQSFYNEELDATSQALEDMANEVVDTFGKVKDVSKTPAITIRGAKITDNYYVREQELHQSLNVDLGFGRIYVTEPVENPEFENTLNIAALVKDVVAETDKDGDETGRAVVKVLVPYTYGSEKKGNQVTRAMQMEFVAGVYEDEEGEYDLGSDLLNYSNEVLDYSYILIAELNTYYLEDKPQVDENQPRRGFGKRAIVDTQRQRKSEFLLTGLDMVKDGDAFPEEDMDEAVQARKKDIAEKMKADEEKEKEDTTKKGRGNFGSGRQTSQPAQQTSTGATTGRRRERSFM